ncbi:unnamed protein product [Blepharisma stoltei]|uniref:Uncharacterized protein n=1 Tax=Blepharisma stoltei TaxID=1481888 RepID=A0AAU9JWD6_9CILI|nr:unnamed protein product [Blepharisma stoltei]
MVELALIRRMQARIDNLFEKHCYESGIAMLERFSGLAKDYPGHRDLIFEHVKTILFLCLEIVKNIPENETSIYLISSCYKLIKPHSILNLSEIFNIKQVLGKLYYESKKFIKAEKFFQASYKLSKEIPLSAEILEFYLFYSKFNLEFQNKVIASSKFAKKILKNANKINADKIDIANLQEKALKILIKIEIGAKNKENIIKLLDYARKLPYINTSKLMAWVNNRFQGLDYSDVVASSILNKYKENPKDRFPSTNTKSKLLLSYKESSLDSPKSPKSIQSRTFRLGSPINLSKRSCFSPESTRVNSPVNFNFKPKLLFNKNKSSRILKPQKQIIEKDQDSTDSTVTLESKPLEIKSEEENSPITLTSDSEINKETSKLFIKLSEDKEEPIKSESPNPNQNLEENTEKNDTTAIPKSEENKEINKNTEIKANEKDTKIMIKSEENKQINKNAEIKVKEDKFNDITKVSIMIQSYVRKLLAQRKFKNDQSKRKGFTGYIAYGRRKFNGILYFVTITYQGFDNQNLRKICGVLARNVDKMNIIVDAYPLVSGIKKPVFSCYSTEEITELLGVWDFEFLKSSLQPVLLDRVKIINNRIDFFATEKVSDPMKRLIYRGKGKLGTSNYYNIRIHEIIQGSVKGYMIAAFTLNQKMEKLLDMHQLIELFGTSQENIILNKVHEIISLLAVENNKLVIKKANPEPM